MKQNKNKGKNQGAAGADAHLTTHRSQRAAGSARAPGAVRKIFILPIRLYQLTLSPLLGTHCRHTPSCSQYAIEAITEWGPVRGMWLGLKRIARCHPWGTSGYDPVPRRRSGKKERD